MKVIVIGGVAAGMSAAAKLRRLDNKAIIRVYEKSADISYAGCGMPYYLGDVITDERKLNARSKADFEKEGIEVFLSHEVVKVNPDTKTVSIINKLTNTMLVDKYDKLLVATGTTANRTNVPGSDLARIFVLNQLSDMRELKSALSEAKSVAIIGGGYIGVEVAENLANKNLKVYMIEQTPQILNTFDFEVAQKAKTALNEIGVNVLVQETLRAYDIHGLNTKVITDKGEYLVDLVIEAIGVRANTAFLENIRINRLPNGAIIVNDRMETSIRDIYAAGDCVAYYHILKKTNVFVPLGTHANKSGRVVAENIAGNRVSFPGIVGSTIVKVDKLAFAKTGIGIDEAKRLNLRYDFVDVVAKNQAGYYPGAKEIFVRIIFEVDTGIIKGAELVGEKGVSDRINIMALAITRGITAKEFSQLDLAYSPPYSTVWDPLQIAVNQIKVGHN